MYSSCGNPLAVDLVLGPRDITVDQLAIIAVVFIARHSQWYLCSSLGTRPSGNRKEGLGDRLGRKCTVRPECRHASDWFMIACQCTFIGNTNRKPLV